MFTLLRILVRNKKHVGTLPNEGRRRDSPTSTRNSPSCGAFPEEPLEFHQNIHRKILPPERAPWNVHRSSLKFPEQTGWVHKSRWPSASFKIPEGQTWMGLEIDNGRVIAPWWRPHSFPYSLRPRAPPSTNFFPFNAGKCLMS